MNAMQDVRTSLNFYDSILHLKIESMTLEFMLIIGIISKWVALDPLRRTDSEKLVYRY